jgi:hypothetical protein
MTDKALLHELLSPLHSHFLGARAAYQAYLDEGRAYRHAGSLKRINLSARALLLGKSSLLPTDVRACATALIGHYDVWLALWDELAERTRPAPGDRFVFENKVTYPREAEERLERLYEELRATVGG